MTLHTDKNGLDGIVSFRMSGATKYVGSSTNVWSHDNVDGRLAVLSITNNSINNQLAVLDATSSSAATIATNLNTLIQFLSSDLKLFAVRHDGT